MTGAHTDPTIIRTMRPAWLLVALILVPPLAGGCVTTKPWQRVAA